MGLFDGLISSGLLFFFVSSFIFGNGAHPFGVYYISGIALLVGWWLCGALGSFQAFGRFGYLASIQLE
jgi:hypothetical protein